jgi:ribosome modulation factor
MQQIIESELSIPPELIAIQGRQAADWGFPSNSCPYLTPAIADRWLRAWHARDMEHRAELTS